MDFDYLNPRYTEIMMHYKLFHFFLFLLLPGFIICQEFNLANIDRPNRVRSGIQLNKGEILIYSSGAWSQTHKTLRDEQVWTNSNLARVGISRWIELFGQADMSHIDYQSEGTDDRIGLRDWRLGVKLGEPQKLGKKLHFNFLFMLDGSFNSGDFEQSTSYFQIGLTSTYLISSKWIADLNIFLPSARLDNYVGVRLTRVLSPNWSAYAESRFGEDLLLYPGLVYSVNTKLCFELFGRYFYSEHDYATGAGLGFNWKI